jgi:hypothetical protein
VLHPMEIPASAGARLLDEPPVAVFVDDQAPVIRFAGLTLTKDQAEQLGHDLFNAVTEIDRAHWYAIDPELAAEMEAQVHADLGAEQLERIAS